MNELVEYTRATAANPGIGLSKGKLYRYILAANGVFVYSRNDYFEVLMPLNYWRVFGGRRQVRGLVELEPRFRICSKVPAIKLQEIVKRSRWFVPDEVLIYTKINPYGWINDIPPQENGKTFCKSRESLPYVPIETHSHNSMPAFFSGTDNVEETGLRIYAVLGKVTHPTVEIKVRVSVYGHYWTIPYEWVFEKCDAVKEAKT